MASASTDRTRLSGIWGARWLVTSVPVLLIATPVVLVLVYAFNAADRGMIWQGFSLRWLTRIFEDRESMRAMYNSLLIAAGVTLVALAVGTMMAFAFSALSGPVQTCVGALIVASVVSPDLAVAISQAQLVNLMGLPPGRLSIALGQLPFATGYMFVVLLAVTQTVRLEPAHAAASDLGAGPIRIFWEVFLPMTRPGWLAGAGFVFCLSFQDFVFSFHLGGSGTSTLAVRIYSMLRRGITPGVNMLFLLLLLLIIFSMVVFRIRLPQEESR